MDHHRTAVQKIHKQRAAGKPATLRHRRFDGTGSIAVHSLRVSGTPARTPAVLADPNGRYRNVLHLQWIEPHEWEQLTHGQRRRHHLSQSLHGRNPLWNNENRDIVK